ncbi:hypothetical protein GCM10009557_01110 [Virgisporangium ochraceum]|uniref:HTH iclR-type domain-containing protein n=1 Tax=Virgisporangium ochraceum TaxID=65505 RepID=A0A8J4EJC5_9ACTN|nr:helix-turn-helix domain-containing protein [Virgisporangium ochraceum]GIJ74142.1 hypothetical protein Voc01_090590 [Virgisporangium ochraceum]
MLRSPTDPPSDMILSVGRAASILDLLADARPPGMSMRGITTRLDLSFGTTTHYIRTLQYLDLVQRWDPGTYTLGLGVFDLARALSRQLTVAGENMPVDLIARATDRDPGEIKEALDLATMIVRSSDPG